MARIERTMKAASPTKVPGLLLGVLRDGTSPLKLAFTLSFGFAIGCFPLLGVTTILCALSALVFRLRQAAIQAGNYLAFPLQLLLVIPFWRLGERVFRAPALPLSPFQLLAQMRSAPDQTMRSFVFGQWHAIIIWGLAAPIMLLLMMAVLTPLLRSRMPSAKPSTTHLRRSAS